MVFRELLRGSHSSGSLNGIDRIAVRRNGRSCKSPRCRGELVPTEAELARQEGREYEPASLLLERIRKERESANACQEVALKRKRRVGNRDGQKRRPIGKAQY
jgi:hypothetical protein